MLLSITLRLELKSVPKKFHKDQIGVLSVFYTWRIPSRNCRHIQEICSNVVIICLNSKRSQILRHKNETSNIHFSLGYILIHPTTCAQEIQLKYGTLWISFSPSVKRFIILLLVRSASDNHRKCKIATRSNIVIDLIMRACIMAANSRTSLAKKTRWTIVSLRYVTVRTTGVSWPPASRKTQMNGEVMWICALPGGKRGCDAWNVSFWEGIHIDDWFHDGRYLKICGKFSRVPRHLVTFLDLYESQEIIMWFINFKNESVRHRICWKFYNNRIMTRTFTSLKFQSVIVIERSKFKWLVLLTIT